MDPHWIEAVGALVVNVVFGIIVKAVLSAGFSHLRAEMLQSKLETVEAITKADGEQRTWVTEHFETKEMAKERHEHVVARLNQKQARG